MLEQSKSISLPSIPKSKETPAQKIKRLEKKLADLQLKNDIMEGMVDIMDNEYGASIRKKYHASISGEKKKKENLS